MVITLYNGYGKTYKNQHVRINYISIYKNTGNGS